MKHWVLGGGVKILQMKNEKSTICKAKKKKDIASFQGPERLESTMFWLVVIIKLNSTYDEL